MLLSATPDYVMIGVSLAIIAGLVSYGFAWLAESEKISPATGKIYDRLSVVSLAGVVVAMGVPFAATSEYAAFCVVFAGLVIVAAVGAIDWIDPRPRPVLATPAWRRAPESLDEEE